MQEYISANYAPLNQAAKKLLGKEAEPTAGLYLLQLARIGLAQIADPRGEAEIALQEMAQMLPERANAMLSHYPPNLAHLTLYEAAEQAIVHVQRTMHGLIPVLNEFAKHGATGADEALTALYEMFGGNPMRSTQPDKQATREYIQANGTLVNQAAQRLLGAEANSFLGLYFLQLARTGLDLIENPRERVEMEDGLVFLEGLNPELAMAILDNEENEPPDLGNDPQEAAILAIQHVLESMRV